MDMVETSKIFIRGVFFCVGLALERVFLPKSRNLSEKSECVCVYGCVLK